MDLRQIEKRDNLLSDLHRTIDNNKKHVRDLSYIGNHLQRIVDSVLNIEQEDLDYQGLQSLAKDSSSYLKDIPYIIRHIKDSETIMGHARDMLTEIKEDDD